MKSTTAPRIRHRNTDLCVNVNEGLSFAEATTISYPLGLYVVGEDGFLDLRGTGFFCNYRDNLFLVTAYHVVASLLKERTQIWVGCNHRVTRLEYANYVVSTDSDNPPVEEDTDLVAIIIPNVASRYHEFKQVSIQHFQSMDGYNDRLGFAYIYFTGLPISKNKLSRTTVTESGVTGYELVTFEYKMATIEQMRNAKRNPDWFQGLCWTKKTRDGNNSCHPRGCSGAPVWMVRKNGQRMDIYLCGIFIEFYKTQNLLIFTRVEVLFDAIDEAFEKHGLV